MIPLKKKAIDIIECIDSNRKLAEIIDFMEFIKVREEREETNNILLNDPEILDRIDKARMQIKNGEFKNVDDVMEDV
ncbi:MAG: hypothetical protein A2Y24_00200 [Clostridiales bacterium GWE2_32_10]|nr:MAG: hypothetical protein A2Y24_00200 [Clostridiales bacterium GWE2_32_10]HBY20222.1 hypothetical protein [Clostridiales bacterium]